MAEDVLHQQVAHHQALDCRGFSVYPIQLPTWLPWTENMKKVSLELSKSNHRKMKEEDMSVSLSRNRQKCCKLTVLCAYKSYEHLTLSAVAATAFARPALNVSKRRVSLVLFVFKASSPFSTINGCSVHSTSLAFGVYSRKVGVVGLTS